jgi:hypothetical protein
MVDMRSRSFPKVVARLSLSAVVALTLPGCAPRTDGGNPPAAASPSAAVRTPTAADYAWIEHNDQLTPGFCLTWVAGLSPHQVIQRLGGKLLHHDNQPPTAGMKAVTAAKGQAVIGVLQLPNWSLIVEGDGRLGVTQERLTALSKETTIISSRRDAEYVGRFLLVQDTAVTVDFDPWQPTVRRGQEPDALFEAMQKAGFTMPPGAGDQGGEDDVDSQGTEAAFALTETLTNIPLTADHLRSATSILATFPDRRNPGPGAIRKATEPQTNPAR